MFSASFIFKPGQYDNEFHRLNEAVANRSVLVGHNQIAAWSRV